MASYMLAGPPEAWEPFCGPLMPESVRLARYYPDHRAEDEAHRGRVQDGSSRERRLGILRGMLAAVIAEAERPVVEGGARLFSEAEVLAELEALAGRKRLEYGRRR